MKNQIVLPEIEHFPVEAGHIAIFARALGDENPVYRDRDHARAQGLPDVIAPPTFTEAGIHFDRAFLFRPRPGQPWLGSGREPSGLPPAPADSGTGMHAQTRFIYHRPLTPGCVLHSRAAHVREWTKQGRRGGALHFFEVEVDFLAPDGTPMVSSSNIYVITDRKISPEASAATQRQPELAELARKARERGLSVRSAAPLTLAQAHSGEAHVAQLVENLTRAQIIQYAGASGDFSPQHVDEVYNTQSEGYPTVFSHGMLSMGLTGRLLTDRLGDNRLKSFEFRFARQVWPGEDLFGRMVPTGAPDAVTGTAEFALTLFNGDGEVAGTGSATAALAG